MTRFLGTWLLPPEIRELDGPTYARRWVDLGFGMRFSVYADKIETPNPDGTVVRDWSEIDYSMQLLREAGMPVQSVKLEIQGAPKHWFDPPAGTYMEGMNSSCRVLTGGVNLCYDPTRGPECSNPPEPIASLQMACYRDFVSRYGGDPMILGVGCENEPDDPGNPLGYYKTLQDDWAPSAERAYREWSWRFAFAARSANSKVPLIGPETSTYGYCRTMLDLDNNRVASVGLRAFDIVTNHVYTMGEGPWPSAALDRIDKSPGNLLAYLPLEVMSGRQHAIGESGDGESDPYLVLPFMQAVHQMGLFRYVVLMIGDSHLFKRSSSGRRTTEPTDVYKSVQTLVRQLSNRHRGVEHQ